MSLPPPAAMNPDTPPIDPPSHPLEYRAIGLIRGRYTPSDKNSSRGVLVTADEVEIKAFMGWLQPYAEKYLDLTQEHLWVVYPKRYPAKDTMSVQLKGFKQAKPGEPPPAGDGYFSIRGEVVKREDKAGFVVVKVRRNRPAASVQEVSIRLEGFVPPTAVGQFCEFECEREGHALVIVDGKSIAPVQPSDTEPANGSAKPSPRPHQTKPNTNPNLPSGGQHQRRHGNQ